MTFHSNWSIKDKGRVGQELKKWAFWKDGTFGELVDYSVRNWVRIIRHKFSWMTKIAPPEYPNLGFFLMRLPDFVAVWAGNELRAFANDADQNEFQRLLARASPATRRWPRWRRPRPCAPCAARWTSANAGHGNARSRPATARRAPCGWRASPRSTGPARCSAPPTRS